MALSVNTHEDLADQLATLKRVTGRGDALACSVRPRSAAGNQAPGNV
jgi:hypothetical protein